MFTTRLTLIASALTLAACGGSPDQSPRRDAIPVLAYQGKVDARSFAHHMDVLRDAGYQTIPLATFVRYLRGERVALPARPFLLTFDDGRADAHEAIDPILRGSGFQAALFVDVGRVSAGDPAYLPWDALAAAQRSGRWDVQLQAGTGKQIVRWGPARGDVGSFYAYRGSEEVLGGWRERVFGDLAWAERQLALHIRGYRPLAFSPPYGNYGQLGTNDPAIPRLLLARLRQSFPVVFTQDRPALATRAGGTAQPVGRLVMTRPDSEDRLMLTLNLR